MIRIDLSGRQASWPAAALDLWENCASKAVREDDTWSRTPEVDGDPILRDVLGEELDLDPRHLVITSGVRAAAMTVGRESDTVVIERPTFLGVPHVISGLGTHVQLVEWEDLPSVTGSARTTWWLTSPARNPDGRTINSILLTRLRDLSESGFRVVQNEVYHWYNPRSERIPGAILVGSLSKLAGTGSRLGWICHPDFTNLGQPERFAGPAGPWQRTWAYFIEGNGLGILAKANVEPVIEAREAFLSRIAPYIHIEAPIDGPSIMLYLKKGDSETKAAAALMEEGLRVGLGTNFAACAPSLRLCFSTVSAKDAEIAARLVAGIADSMNALTIGKRKDVT